MWGITSIQGCLFVLSYSSILQHDTRFQQHPKIRQLSKPPSSPDTQIPPVMMCSYPHCQCSHCPRTFSITSLPLILSSSVITLCLFSVYSFLSVISSLSFTLLLTCLLFQSCLCLFVSSKIRNSAGFSPTVCHTTF